MQSGAFANDSLDLRTDVQLDRFRPSSLRRIRDQRSSTPVHYVHIRVRACARANRLIAGSKPAQCKRDYATAPERGEQSVANTQ
jgi:hypothetical protein